MPASQQPEPAPGAATAPSDAPPASPPVGSAAGLFRFTVEGRHAPGLFVGGWLSTVIGAMGVSVGLLAGQTLPGILLYVIGLGILLVGLVLLGGSQSIERRAAGLAYAGPSPILVLAANAAGIYFVGAVVGTPLALLGVFDDPADRPFIDLFGVVLQALVVVGILRLLVVGPGALSWAEMGIRSSGRIAVRDLAWGATFAIPVVVITAIAVNVLVTVIGQTPESVLPPAGTSVGLAVNLIAGAVIAPFYEELLFRGFATTAWARVVSAGAAIVRTSILFAIAHVISQGGDTFGQALGIAVVAAAGRLPVALALGWVFIRRRSLWASIGLHAAFNGIQIVIAESLVRSLAQG